MSTHSSIIQTERLQALGYSISMPNPRKMSLDEILGNSFGLLDDYPKMGLFFIHFPDQQIQVTSADGHALHVFGRCEFGHFATDAAGHVVVINSEPGCHFPDRLVFANTSLGQFQASYAKFLACLFDLKAMHFDENQCHDASKIMTSKLSGHIQARDEAAMADGHFWPQMIYMMDDAMVKFSLPMSHYMEAGRI